MKSLISSGRLDTQIYFFGYFPVVFYALVLFVNSKYRVLQISKTESNVLGMDEFLNSEYLTQLNNYDEFILKTSYSTAKVKLIIKEYDM